MPLSLFNMAVSLAVLENNANIPSTTALSDSVVAGLLPNGLGLAFPLIVNAQNQGTPTFGSGGTGTSGSGGTGTATTLTQVPNVVGQPLATAQTSLTNVGLSGVGQNAYDPTDAAGTVVQQSPDADSFAPVGSQVLLTVSQGPYQTPSSTGLVAISTEARRQLESVQRDMEDRLSAAVATKIRENESGLFWKIEKSMEQSLAEKLTENQSALVATIKRVLDEKLGAHSAPKK